MIFDFGTITLLSGHNQVEVKIGKAFHLQVLAFREFRRARSDDTPALWCKD